jgi:hypothetical protein
MRFLATIPVVVLTTAALAFSGQDDDPIASQVEKAREAYAAAVEAAQRAYEQAIEARAAEAAEKADLDAVEKLEAAAAAYRDDQQVVPLAELKDDSAALTEALEEARIQLRKALSQARDDYTRARKTTEARALDDEIREKLAAPRPKTPTTKPASPQKPPDRITGFWRFTANSPTKGVRYFNVLLAERNTHAVRSVLTRKNLNLEPRARFILLPWRRTGNLYTVQGPRGVGVWKLTLGVRGEVLHGNAADGTPIQGLRVGVSP